LPRFSGGEYIFTTTRGVKPINGNSKAKARLDRLMLRYLKAAARLSGESPDTVTLPPFIVHDLRRVVRSNLSALDVEDHISEQVLGHGRKGLQRVYDLHRYLPQQRQALEAWAARLHQIVKPQPPAPTADNVVNLPQKRKRVSS
jgi:hypothetical protein